MLVDVPDTALRGSREHGYYLDQLWRHALATDATHLCTLDVDAFPIRDDWVDAVAARITPESGLAAVSRLENGDTELPHPSCTLARRDFFERFKPSFSPDSDGTPEFRRFRITTGQSADTGIQLGYALWTAGLPWGRLVRTNAVNPHYLMAGIYGDAVFHLGGIGRGKLFREDLRALHGASRHPAARAAARRQWRTGQGEEGRAAAGAGQEGAGAHRAEPGDLLACCAAGCCPTPTACSPTCAAEPPR